MFEWSKGSCCWFTSLSVITYLFNICYWSHSLIDHQCRLEIWTLIGFFSQLRTLDVSDFLINVVIRYSWFCQDVLTIFSFILKSNLFFLVHLNIEKQYLKIQSGIFLKISRTYLYLLVDTCLQKQKYCIWSW